MQLKSQYLNIGMPQLVIVNCKSFWKARVKRLIVVRYFPLLRLQSRKIGERRNQASNGWNIRKRAPRINKN